MKNFLVPKYALVGLSHGETNTHARQKLIHSLYLIKVRQGWLVYRISWP